LTEQFTVQYPAVLWALLPLALLAGAYLWRRVYGRESGVALPSRRLVTSGHSWRTRTYRFLPILRLVAVILVIVALARPGKGITYSSVRHMGIDIFIALDVSGSMKGEDFQPKNRLTVAKDVIRDFIERRESDRIGMVIFAGDAYLQAPLTIEHDMVQTILDEIDFDSVSVDGTAIGDAVALAASRMMEDEERSRVILLVTDGMNNRGAVDPETAARACKEKDIRIYSVGIGREGKVPMPGRSLFGRPYLVNHFDPAGLEKISRMTGGAFYRAETGGILREKIEEIDRLEKSELRVRQYHEFHDRFQVFLLAAAALFALEILLRSLVYRKVP
jgi:Ca-activated chloride channel family protein